MSPARISEIERYLETDHEGSFSNGALAELLSALKASNERVAKLREALLGYIEDRGSVAPPDDVASLLKETEPRE